MSEQERTELRNVDLDIVSDSPLDSLVEAFGDRVDVLHVGEWGKSYHARVDLAGSGYQDDATDLINRFVSLVENLPEGPRTLWDEAQTREFDIGIQVAAASPEYACSVGPATLERVSRVRGTIVVTVYAPEEQRRSSIAVTWQPGNADGD